MPCSNMFSYISFVEIQLERFTIILQSVSIQIFVSYRYNLYVFLRANQISCQAILTIKPN